MSTNLNSPVKIARSLTPAEEGAWHNGYLVNDKIIETGVGVFWQQTLCLSHFIYAYDFEPEMGDQGVTFAPGKCFECGASQVVFWLTDY